MLETNTADTETELENENAAPLELKTARINISGDTVSQSIAHLDDEQRKLVLWSYSFARDNEWDWKEAVRQYKISTTTLWRVWQDQYRQPDFYFEGEGKNRVKVRNPKAGERIALDNFCQKILSYKRIADERRGITALPFVETTTWQKMDHVFREVLISQSIGFIWGESQIGKTTCANEHQRRNNHGQTVMVTAPPAAGVQLLCKMIAEALHIGESSFDKTFLRICKALNPQRLLIIDEAHMLFETYQRGSIARCLATLRQIHDRTGCGMVIMGTEVFPTEAKKSEFRNTMKQFFRRGTLTLQLGVQPPWVDIQMICQHYHLTLPDEAEMRKDASLRDPAHVQTLQLLAREDGLGKITKYLAAGARMAAKRSEPLTWDHFNRYYDIADRMSRPVR